MAHASPVQIVHCFPQAPTDMRCFLDKLVELASTHPTISHAGYRTAQELREDLAWRYENATMQTCTAPPLGQRRELEKIITTTLQKAMGPLPVPAESGGVFVFVFPWIGPFDKDDEIMGYVSGFTPHEGVIHIFLDLNKYKQLSLQQTITHEYNHAVFFYYHPEIDPNRDSSHPTIRDVLVWEGIAENFVEEVLEERSPFSRVLEKEEAFRVLAELQPALDTEVTDGNNLYEQVFFGSGGQYKKWTGYSLGYHIVKLFRDVRPDDSWESIVRSKPAVILPKMAW